MSVRAQSQQINKDNHPSVTCLPILKRDRTGSLQSDCEVFKRNAGRRALSRDLECDELAQIREECVLKVCTGTTLVDR